MFDSFRKATLLLVAAACSADPAATVADGDVPAPPDAAPGRDAAPESPTHDLDGAWHFERGAGSDPGRFGCDLSIANGRYEILCASPDAEDVVGPDCVRSRADRRYTGTLQPPAFDGRHDLVEEYQGAGCAALGVPSGIPVVTPEVGLMTANQVTPGIGEGFLEHLDGEWQWAYDDTYLGDSWLCDVAFAAGAVSVRCPGYPIPAATDCTARTDLVVTATVGADAMTGALWTEIERAGTGCEKAGLAPFEASEPTPLMAERR